ncbi:aromatic ring-hydroxylating dioxygenase subunit alpha [Croceicoccus bisphenolivorans]|uniref:aromatic ring-hydroxylating dioxygenase subunit alpha n=1 Tax=Croceicoccus bisphenolivorans TaxID=1783232 RepID=UPI00082F915A|nr:aromatic ring-hydroxylating dioxygenase subunit alpha [Croceicoccus bisphenolivorans]
MHYVRNAWYVAAWTADLDGAKPTGLRILGERIVLFRTESGKLVALEDRCVHRLAPLSLGRCEGERLRCMYHGILFDSDGAVTEIPGQDIVPRDAKVRAYPVVDRHGWAWVWMGDPELADDSAIPATIGTDHPDYLMGHGFLDYDCAAQLISENLLDFSHIGYVHADSFPQGDQMAKTHADIRPIDRGIRYRRWVENLASDAAGFPAAPLDHYMEYDYVVPGILMMHIAGFPLGTAKKLEFGEPDLSDAVRDLTFTGQAVTPIDERTTRYFFCYGMHRAHGNEEMIEPMMQLVQKAFAEDKVMIEAQQKVIDETPEPRMIPTSHDRSITIYNRMLDKMIREETERQAVA